MEKIRREAKNSVKTAVATDTNSGLNKEECIKLGIYLLPMPFSISEKDFLEGVNLSSRDFFAAMEAGEDIRTSQPSPGQLCDFWDEILKENDNLVYIPMSSGLTGTYETAWMLADGDKYKSRVYVVDNKRISVTQYASVLEAKRLADNGTDPIAITQILEKEASDSVIYLTVETLKYLKKGGRITPAAAALGTLLKIKPVLTIQGDKLDAFAKVRTMKQAKNVMLNALEKDLAERFSDVDIEKTDIYIAHANEYDAAVKFRDEVYEFFSIKPENMDIKIQELSLSICTHVGPGTLALAAAKRHQI